MLAVGNLALRADRMYEPLNRADHRENIGTRAFPFLKRVDQIDHRGGVFETRFTRRATSELVCAGPAHDFAPISACNASAADSMSTAMQYAAALVRMLLPTLQCRRTHAAR